MKRDGGVFVEVFLSWDASPKAQPNIASVIPLCPQQFL